MPKRPASPQTDEPPPADEPSTSPNSSSSPPAAKKTKPSSPPASSAAPPAPNAFTSVFDTGGGFSAFTSSSVAAAPAADSGAPSAKPASSSAFGTSGFATFGGGNPFAAALEKAGNRSQGFGFGAAKSTGGSGGFGFGNGFGAKKEADKDKDKDKDKDGEEGGEGGKEGEGEKDKQDDATADAGGEGNKDEDANSNNGPAPPAAPAPPLPLASLPEPKEPYKNGEESSTLLLQARVKSFRLVGTEWKELGVGPIRILAFKKGDDGDEEELRLVHRRESTPGGPSTKVLINVTLSTVVLGSKTVGGEGEKRSTLTDEGTGKFLKLTAVLEGGVESYLIKFKEEKGREEFGRECADRLS